MRKYLEKVLSLVFGLILYTLLITGIHEQFHFLMAKALGVGGYVTFNYGWGGYFNFAAGVVLTPLQNFLVRIAGGIGTGIVLGGLWYLAFFQTKYTIWELDDTFVLFVLALGQLFYAFAELLPSNLIQYGGGLSFALAVGIGVLLYGKAVLIWFQEDD